MTDIVQRLRFDAARCETTFSKGVATNIEEAIAEIERLRAVIRDDVDCPRPANGAPDGINVGQCVARGECGCCYGAALVNQQLPAMEQKK